MEIYMILNFFSCNHASVVWKRKSKTCTILLWTKSVILTQRKFLLHFKGKRGPSRSVILHIIHKLLAQETVCNNFKRRSDRKRIQGHWQTSVAWGMCFREAQRGQCAKLGQKVCYCCASAHRISQVDAEFFPSKMSIHKTLAEAHKTAQNRFCAWSVMKCGQNSFPFSRTF